MHPYISGWLTAVLACRLLTQSVTLTTTWIVQLVQYWSVPVMGVCAIRSVVSHLCLFSFIPLRGERWWIFRQVQWYFQQWLDTSSQIIGIVAKIFFTRIMYIWNNRHAVISRDCSITRQKTACISTPDLSCKQLVDAIGRESQVTVVLIGLTNTYADMRRWTRCWVAPVYTESDPRNKYKDKQQTTNSHHHALYDRSRVDYAHA